MEITGYLASVFIGLALGLIGGGGSVLTVPVLVYLFKVDAVIATAYSLFIVGVTSAVGSVTYVKKKLISFKIAIVFGLPSIVAVFLTRAYVLPFIPAEVFVVGSFILTKSILLLVLFAVLMILSSYSMIKRRDTSVNCDVETNPLSATFLVVFQGFVVGAVTGLVGAGGGFLIIPVLVNVLHLDIKNAIGTSLLIIAFNSLFGFLISVQHFMVDWFFLIKIIGLAILGVFLGSYWSKRVSSKKLKPAFGWFVLVMGIYILVKEIFFS